MRTIFAVGTGRCGSLALYNLLSGSPTTLALHEGQTREPFALTYQEKLLPPLTMENLQCYWDSSQAVEVLTRLRVKPIEDLLNKTEKKRLVEVAYYLSPFVSKLPTVFPDSKLIYMVRSGVDFVRSVSTSRAPDPTPVGYSDRSQLSPIESFIEAGRLKMKDVDDPTSRWHSLTVFEKNAWLWAETNRIIVEGLKSWSPRNILVLRLEKWRGNKQAIQDLLTFLEIDDVPEEVIEKVAGRPINTRMDPIVPEFCNWPSEQREQFRGIAGHMMDYLDYTL